MNENLEKLLARFTVKDVEQAVKLAFEFHGRRLNEMRDDCFTAYQEASLRHTPFKERESLIDERKLAWIKEEEEKLSAWKKNYKVKPLEFCIKGDDYDYIKTVGLRRFVELHLQDFIHQA